MRDPAVGLEDVQVAVVVEVRQRDAEAGVLAAGGAQAEGRGGVLEPRALVEEQRIGLAFQVHHQHVRIRIVVDVRRGNAHAGLRFAVLVHAAAPGQGRFYEAQAALVQPQLIDRHVVGDEHVRVAVAVEIRADDAEAVAELQLQPGGGAHVREGAVAVVAEQCIRRRGLVVLRRAVGAHAGHEALELRLLAPFDVVGDVEV